LDCSVRLPKELREVLTVALKRAQKGRWDMVVWEVLLFPEDLLPGLGVLDYMRCTLHEVGDGKQWHGQSLKGENITAGINRAMEKLN
jgi:hypothetical protein